MRSGDKLVSDLHDLPGKRPKILRRVATTRNWRIIAGLVSG